MRHPIHEIMTGILALILAAAPAFALDYTWDGGGASDSNWTTAANWDLAGYPSTKDDKAIFNNSAGNVKLDSNVAVGIVEVNGSGNWNWGGSSTLSLSNAFNYGSTGSNGQFNAYLGGTGNLNVAAGRLIISSPNTISGDKVISGGILVVTNLTGSALNTPLGSSGTVYVGDTAGSQDAQFHISLGRNSVFSLPISVREGNSGTSTISLYPTWDLQYLSGNITFAKDLYIYAVTAPNLADGDAQSQGNVMLNGALSGTGSVYKIGPGRLDFNRADDNSYTGKTYVLSGRLVLGDNVGGITWFTTSFQDELVLGDTNGTNNVALTARWDKNVTLNVPLRVRAGSSGTARLLPENGNGGLMLTTNVILEKNLIVKGGEASGNPGNGPVLFSGQISGQGGFIKQNGGTMTYSNSVSPAFAGNTRIEGGTVKWLSLSPVGGPCGFGGGNIELANGYFTLDATPNQDWILTNGLMGRGTVTVETASNILTINGRAITPGGTGTVGNLTISGSLNMNNSASLSLLLRSVTNSLVLVSGAFNIVNASLDFAFLNGYIPAPGDTITVAHASSSITGTFANDYGTGMVISTNGWKCHVIYNGGADNKDLVLHNFSRSATGTILAVR